MPNLLSLFQYDGDQIPLEICLLRRVSCLPGVVRLMDYYDCGDAFNLILARPGWGNGGNNRGSKDLFDYITERGRLEEAVARAIVAQVVTTVLQAHQQGVIHRDIKDENILVSIKKPFILVRNIKKKLESNF